MEDNHENCKFSYQFNFAFGIIVAVALLIFFVILILIILYQVFINYFIVKSILVCCVSCAVSIIRLFLLFILILIFLINFIFGTLVFWNLTDLQHLEIVFLVFFVVWNYAKHEEVAVYFHDEVIVPAFVIDPGMHRHFLLGFFIFISLLLIFIGLIFSDILLRIID